MFCCVERQLNRTSFPLESCIKPPPYPPQLVVTFRDLSMKVATLIAAFRNCSHWLSGIPLQKTETNLLCILLSERTCESKRGFPWPDPRASRSCRLRSKHKRPTGKACTDARTG